MLYPHLNTSFTSRTDEKTKSPATVEVHSLCPVELAECQNGTEIWLGCEHVPCGCRVAAMRSKQRSSHTAQASMTGGDSSPRITGERLLADVATMSLMGVSSTTASTKVRSFLAGLLGSTRPRKP